MKIGTKISFFYTLITICLVLVVVFIFNIFTSRYITQLYNSYLMEKAFLTAQKHWEKDEVDEASYRLIEQKYNELLPQASEILLNADSIQTVNDTLNKYLTLQQQQKLFAEERPISFNYQGYAGAALYYPDNEGNFIVLVMAIDTYGKKIQEHMLWLTILLLFSSAIIIFLLGKVYSGRILYPLKRLLKELKRIRGHNLEKRIPITGNKDELDSLSHSINDMLDRIDIAFQAEKSFVSSASHELNNPVTAIQGECEISLMKERSPEEYIEALSRISTESQRLSQLIKHLLFLSRQEHELLRNSTEEINLKNLLKEMTEENPRLELTVHQPDASQYTIKANYYLINIAIQNIIENACKYSKEKINVELTKKNEKTILKIKDFGIGIPENEILNIFQSFYRATNTRNYHGQGIGLSLSYKIFAAFGAKIEVDSKVNEYTTISIIYT